MPVYLITIEVNFEERIGRDTNVDTSDPHVDTKQKEITMVEMTNTIVQPSWNNMVKENPLGKKYLKKKKWLL